MEAPRGAREPTGTNGPTPHQPPQARHPPPKRRAPPQGRARDRQPHTPNRGQQGGGRATRHPPPPPGPQTRAKQRQQRGGARKSRNHYTNHDQPTPHPATRRANKGGRTTQSCGGHSTGETPSNIPNLEAKPGSANGTATARLWESRTPPQHTLERDGARKRAVPLLFTPQYRFALTCRLILGG